MHMVWRVECTQYVFVRLIIKGSFTAHAAVRLCQQGSGDIDPVKPPVKRAGYEATDILRNTTADRDNLCLFSGLQRDDLVKNTLCKSERFMFFNCIQQKQILRIS